ncbi:MAG: N-acetyltransferase [Rhodospirillales bacterium]
MGRPEAAAALHARCFPEEAWDAASLIQLSLQPGAFALHLIEAEASADGAGLPAAFLLARLAVDEVELLTLAVAPEQRRQGLATTLLSGLIARTRPNGGRSLFLEVAESNRVARAFYDGVGLQTLARRPAYYRNGDDALVMHLEFVNRPPFNSDVRR